MPHCSTVRRREDSVPQITAIHQFHATVAWGDAIGNILFTCQKLFRQMGYCSEIFRIHAQETVRNETYAAEDFRVWSSPTNLLLVHYSMGWQSFPAFLHFKDTRILVYHNITPAEYFEGISSHAAEYAKQGRGDLPRLAKYFSAAIADSEFNAAELRQAGVQNVVVIPPLIDLSAFSPDEKARVNTSKRAEWINWLFVGRLAPNKKQDDLIRAFSYYQRQIQPRSRLFLVGSNEGMEIYSSQLLDLVTELCVRNVCFLGKLAEPELLKVYRDASVFVCLSEHEGFCIPLVEAMKSGLPIVAYHQPAVAETLQGSGVLLDEKSPKSVAEAVQEILTNTALRNSLGEKQQIRVQDFEYSTVARAISSFIEAFGAKSTIKTMAGIRKSPTRLACASLRYYPHIGGAEVVLQNVLERLVKDGFECTVYATDAQSVEDIFTSRGGSETEECINGVRVVRSPITNPPKKAWLATNLDRLSIYGHGGWSYGQFRHLLHDNYDIVHSSPFPSTHNYLAYAAASIRGKPFVCSPHLHLADPYHSQRSSLFWMMRGAAAVLANTRYERDFYINSGVPPHKVHVTGVGCDDTSQALPGQEIPRCLRAIPDYDAKRKLIFVGRKDQHKGISDILNALRVLTFGRDDILFLCVGPETPYSRELWSHLASELKGQVAALDEVGEGEKHALIRDSEMLILMSTTESFGIVLLEAWLHEKPVIGARAGALQAVIQDGKDGLLVEPGNYVELAATIEFLLDNPSICSAMGTNGRSKTVTEYTWDGVAEKWSRIFWTISNPE
jgi:L-malate glycosyltransferase